MENITFAPSYVVFYPMLAEIARKNHYSLAIHGSVGKHGYSDCDLVAVPWDEEAVDQEVLMKAFWDYCSSSMLPIFKTSFEKEFYPVDKPHGRKAWMLELGNGCTFDISVMPKQPLYSTT